MTKFRIGEEIKTQVVQDTPNYRLGYNMGFDDGKKENLQPILLKFYNEINSEDKSHISISKDELSKIMFETTGMKVFCKHMFVKSLKDRSIIVCQYCGQLKK